jgi:hypothetical protein
MISAFKPEAVVAMLAGQGIIISERTLKERARKLGACRIIGNTMFLLPADIDRILEAAKPEPKPCASIEEQERGTSISLFRAKGSGDRVEQLIEKRRKKLLTKPFSASVISLKKARKGS